MIVINDVSQNVFGSDNNQVIIVTRDLKQQVTALKSKIEISMIICDLISNQINLT